MAYRSFSLVPTLSDHLLSDRLTQIDHLFSRLTGEAPVRDAPAYNLLKKDKDHYEMAVSVPGYTQDELDIAVLNNQLTISGKPRLEEIQPTEEKDTIKWLHRAISKSEFSFSFNLDHRIKILEAALESGLLTINFAYDIPEQEKPQKIAIGSMKRKSGCVIEHHAP